MPARRCPMCHRANDSNAWQCGKCGYEFGQSVDKAIELVRDGLKTAWISFVVWLVVDAGMFAGFIYALLHGWIVFSGLAVGFATVWTFRSAQKVARLRASMRSLQRQKLPEAKVVSG